MSGGAWIEIILLNSVTATLLAVPVALYGARSRRAPVVHALWLLVLIELVSFPLLRVGVVPRVDLVSGVAPASRIVPVEAFTAGAHGNHPTPRLRGRGASLSAASPVAAPTFDGAPALSSFERRPSPQSAWPWSSHETFQPWFALFVAAGGTVLLALTAVRALRFRRSLSAAPLAGGELTLRAHELARALGLRRAPRIRLVPAPVPPSLWGGPGTCDILLPTPLLDRLTPDERDGLLAHELAHVRRRDHWVRAFELTVAMVYWWHPVMWWARRMLRRAEEQSCDALVMQVLPNHARSYVESLLKTVEFLAAEGRPAPPLAPAVHPLDLKERVTMIVKRETSSTPTRLLRLFLAVAALAILTVSPSWLSSAPRSEATHTPPADRQHVLGMVELEHARLLLEKELHNLELKRIELETKMEAAHLELETARLRSEIDELLAQGLDSEAARVERQLAELQARAQLERERRTNMQALMAKRFELQFRMRELELQHELAMAHGDPTGSEELELELRSLEKALKELDLEEMQAELEWQRRILADEEARLQESRPDE